MSQVAAMLRGASEIRARLKNPPNAVRDDGIDLKRKVVPIQQLDEAQEVPVTEIKSASGVFLLPYDIGTVIPRYSLRYDVPYQRPEGALTVRTIQRAVCHKFGCTLASMLGPSRVARLVRPRQIAMYLAKIILCKSLPEIGRRFGGRDHTTVLHAVRKIESLRATDADVDAVVIELSNLLVASPSQPEDAACSSQPKQTSTAP